MSGNDIVEPDSEEYVAVVNSDEVAGATWTGVQFECGACGDEHGLWSIEFEGNCYGYCAACGELTREDK